MLDATATPATEPTATALLRAPSGAMSVTDGAPPARYNEFRFVVPAAARPRVSRRAREAAPSIDSVAVPPGVSLLCLDADGARPVLSPLDPRGPAPTAPCVEPVTLFGRPVLLAVPGAAAMAVNGAPAAPLTIIRPGDYVWWSDSAESFLLGLRLRPFIGPLPDALTGRRCGVCKGVLAVGARVWVCPHCENALHLDDGADEPLECARMATECPACRSPVRLESGWVGVAPEITP